VGAGAKEDRARRYRVLATELRASAATMTHERTRLGMLEAATVWDRLADFVDRQPGLFLASMRTAASRHGSGGP